MNKMKRSIQFLSALMCHFDSAKADGLREKSLDLSHSFGMTNKTGFGMICILACLIAVAPLAAAETTIARDGNLEVKLSAELKNARSPEKREAALSKLSDYYLSINRLHNVVDCYRRTINDANIGKKEKYKYYMIVGDICLGEKNLSSVIEYYQESINVLPRLETARLKLARVYAQSDLNELAKQAYLDDLRFNKMSFDADFGIANIYLKQGLHTEAMEYFRKALAIRPDAELYRRTALCAELSGDVKIACQMLTQIPSKQMLFEDFVNLGRLYEEGGKSKEAEQSFSLALKMNTERVDGYLCLALLYMENNNFEPAEKLLKAAQEKAPAEGTIHFFLGAVYNSEGKTELARAEMKKAGSLARTDVLKKYSQKFQNYISGH
jgi:tetratricopeptide (TPR) repeat protein